MPGSRTAFRHGRVAAVAALAGLLSACGSGAAPQTLVDPAANASMSRSIETPSPSPPVVDDSELIANSEAVDDALMPMYRLIERGEKGFARVIEDNRAKSATIQWKRPIPQNIAMLAGTSENGVEIVVEPVPFSRADIDQAISRLESAAKADEIDRPISYTAAEKFDGLLIGFGPAQFDNANDPAARARLEGVAWVPVTIVRAAPTEAATAG